MKTVISRFIPCIALVLLFVLPDLSLAKTYTLDMVPPVSGVAHINTPFVPTPDVLMDAPLSDDQNLSNLFDNSQNTFYQPSAGSNAPQIGSDVLLRFEFPELPQNAIIQSVTLSVGISDQNSDGLNDMGFGFLSFNRTDPTRYLDVNIDPPGTKGAFLISEMTPPFDIPPIVGIQVPIPSIFSMTLSENELTVGNVRNLSAVLKGVNEAPPLF